jgi:hypothetical protein
MHSVIGAGEQSGMSPSQLKAIRNGHALPREQHREALIRAATEFARAQLRAAGRAAPAGDLEACAAYLTENIVPVP